MGCGASAQKAVEEPPEPSEPLGTLAGEIERTLKDFPEVQRWWFEVPNVFAYYSGSACLGSLYPEPKLRDPLKSVELQFGKFYTVLELAVTVQEGEKGEFTAIMARIEDPPGWTLYFETVHQHTLTRHSPMPRRKPPEYGPGWYMNSDIFNQRVKPEEKTLRVTGSENQSVNGIYRLQRCPGEEGSTRYHTRNYTPGKEEIRLNWAYPIWEGQGLKRENEDVKRYLFYSAKAGAWRIDCELSDVNFYTSSVPTEAWSPVGLEWDKGTRIMAASAPSKGLVGSAAAWGLEPVAQNTAVWGHLCSMLKVTDPENLGWGRDVKETDVYNALTPVLAWKVSCHSRAQLYQTAKGMVKEDIRTCKELMGISATQTKLDNAADAIGCDRSMNEKLLLHGTKPETLSTILSNGLSEKFSCGLLGKGIYLAEDASKIDQYCTSDSGDELGALREKMYTEVGIEHPGRVFYAIVVRAALGFTITTKDMETNMAPPNQGVFATSDKRELTPIPDSDPPVHYHTLVGESGPCSEGFTLSRHREFVVFNANRVLEDYVVAFRRQVDDGLPLPKRQDKPPEVQQEQALWD